MASVIDHFPQVEIKSRAEWRRWLEKHHDASPGIWLVTYKKAEGDAHVSYKDAVEEALCYGWIDSVGRKLDDSRTQLLYTPRKPKSPWSAVNKGRIARLIGDGLMTPAGMAKIEAAKKDGSWNKLNASDALTEPPDLIKVFTENGQAKSHWDAFPPTVRKATLEWIYAARRPETRTARIAETVKLSANNERPRQWIKKEPQPDTH